uniref:Si:dkey-283j8.1 n=1 Tax=Amphilophus citrinellus TaxID=61819 RepID=A0A3Q0S5E7_AMPCI
AVSEFFILSVNLSKVHLVRRALWLVLGMLSLSLLLVVLGIYTTTRTESLNVTGYASGVICFFFHPFLLQLTAAIVFLSFGIILSSLCLVIDGVSIALNMDMRPLKAGRCQYYSSGVSYIYETFYTSVSRDESCTMMVRSGTCYCCDLYDCANGGYLSNYYEFVGVESCEEVFTVYILIWTLASLNLTAFFTGILTTAVLGSIKDLVRHPQQPRGRSPVIEPASSPTAPLVVDAKIHTAHQLHPVNVRSTPSHTQILAQIQLQIFSSCVKSSFSQYISRLTCKHKPFCLTLY